jgi:hypothetical protein
MSDTQPDEANMCFDYDPDQEFRDWEAKTAGKVSIKGEISGAKEGHGACDGVFEFRTNGPQGGGPTCGGFLTFSFTNLASTRMEVAVDGIAHEFVNSVTITFRGDEELHAAAECFEFLAAQLKYIRKLRKLH